MADIDMNRLIGNATYQIKIVPPEGAFKYISGLKTPFVITGYLTNQITWGSANQWEGFHSGLGMMKDQEANMIKGEAVATQVGVDTGEGQHAMTGITETIARWTGASKPSFSFNVMFIATSPGADIISPVKTLIRGCLPHENSGKILKGTMMAPYGYKYGITGEDEAEPDEGLDYWNSGGEKLQGTWTVQVGKWFKAPRLVLDSVSVNFSQQCAPNGKPLYAEAQLVFQCWRLLKANELEKFFG